MSNQENSRKRTSTGIDGLDTLLSGGIVEGSTVLIVGGPGSGKSVLSTQFLNEGLKNNEGAIYVSLDYRRDAFFKDMLNFGWNLEEYEKNGRFLFLEGSAIKRMPQTKNSDLLTYSPDDLTLEDLVDLLTLHIEKIGAKKVVIDSLTALTFTFPDEIQRRAGILSLMEALAKIDVTTLVITEATLYNQNREITTEEYLSDGVIGMFVLKDGTRAIQISKMRGLPVDNKPRPYNIVNNLGIEVFPTETIFSEINQ